MKYTVKIDKFSAKDAERFLEVLWGGIPDISHDQFIEFDDDQSAVCSMVGKSVILTLELVRDKDNDPRTRPIPNNDSDEVGKQ